MFDNFKVGKKVGLGFGVVLVFLLAVSMVAFFGLQAAVSNFSEYRATARQTNELGRVQANLLLVRLGAKEYILSGSDNAKTTVNERLKAYAPHGHWKTMTFLAALKHDGIEAPCVFDGPINGARFNAWVKEMLCPTLKQGDIVIMDNLSSHKNAAVREAIRAKGARLLFLPPYSPDLNPIEQTFSKIKHWMRMAQARSVDTVQDVLADIINTITPNECINYFRNSAYDHS